jgi:hypothetical protein
MRIKGWMWTVAAFALSQAAYWAWYELAVAPLVHG